MFEISSRIRRTIDLFKAANRAAADNPTMEEIDKRTLEAAREIVQARWCGAEGNEVMVKVAGFSVVVDQCQALIDDGEFKLMLIDGKPEMRGTSPLASRVECKCEVVERICSAVRMHPSDNESWEVGLGNHVVHEHLGEVSDARAAVLNIKRQIREAAK